MTDEQIVLVQTSFDRIIPVAEEAAVLFYARLFELDPSLRPLFTADIRELGLKLMQMLELVVNSLRDFETLRSELRALGFRHAVYGVEDHHYEMVEAALFWTFEKALEDEFTLQTREAWTEVYELLARTMKDGGHAGNAAMLHQSS